MSRVRRASLVLLGLLVPSSAQATAADLFGIGPRSQALAGSGATLDIGSEAAFVNPAGLAWARSSELVLGVHEARFSFDVSGGHAALSGSTASGILVGAVVPLRIGDQRIAFGIATLSPPDVVVRARLPLEETPTAPLLAEAPGLSILLSGWGSH